MAGSSEAVVQLSVGEVPSLEAEARWWEAVALSAVVPAGAP